MNKKILCIGFSLNLTALAFAGSVSISELNECDRTVYTSIGDCNQAKSPCLELPKNDPGICGAYKLVNTYGGARKSVDECSGQADCQEKLESKNCLASQGAFIDADYTFVYCMEKVGQEIHIDQAKVSAFQATKAQEDLKEANLQKAIAAMDCGRRVLATMIVQNAPKNLTPAQIAQQAQTYGGIKGLLETGSLVTARGAILAVNPDGVTVTAEDKTALVKELDDCKPQ